MKEKKENVSIVEDDNETFFKKPYMIMILALISCFLWGSAFPSIKLGYEIFNISSNNTYGKILFAGYRFFISSAMIGIFCAISGKSLRIKKEDVGKLIILGLIQTGIQYTFFYIGLSNTSGTKGSILAATNTFFSVLLAHFFYEEDKLNLKKVLGVLLGFIGVTIVNMRKGGFSSGFKITGEGFVILSSLTGALAGIYTKKLAKNISPFAVSAYQLLTGSIVLIVTGFLGGQRGLSFTPKGTGLLLYMGFISAAAFSIWTFLLKYNGVGKVSIYKFTIPVFGVFLSYIFLNERNIGYNVFLAIILVSAGIILINKDK